MRAARSGEATTLVAPTASLAGVQFFHQLLQAEIVGGPLPSTERFERLQPTVGTF
ncbi:MAG: hypothetical protein IT456_17700 [Planctomycetes bacterium]|nr:hypothetical protein [Planctomycetota bacterium]